MSTMGYKDIRQINMAAIAFTTHSTDCIISMMKNYDSDKQTTTSKTDGIIYVSKLCVILHRPYDG